VETAAELSRRIYAEGYRRGWNRGQRKVVMGDGAELIWNIRQEQFPEAIEIVDLYHALQHLWALAGKPYSSQEALRRRWVIGHQPWLAEGRIDKLMAALRSLPAENLTWPMPCKRKQTISMATENACAIPSFVVRSCL
jgi:transposase